MVKHCVHVVDDRTNVWETPGISYQTTRNLMELKAAFGRTACGVGVGKWVKRLSVNEKRRLAAGGIKR